MVRSVKINPVKINPVKATCMKYKGKCDIVDINDTCYGICAAFSGTTDPFNMDPNCTEACDKMVEQKKIDQYGVGNCDHQAPRRPVIWNQIPRFVPQLVKSMSPDKARDVCMQKCIDSVPNLINECQDRCLSDYNAIEQYDQPTFTTLQKKEDKKMNPLLILVPIFVFILLVILSILYFRSRI